MRRHFDVVVLPASPSWNPAADARNRRNPLELLRRRYRVRPQVSVASYRIDLVVEGTSARLEVECDGDAWHGPERYDFTCRRRAPALARSSRTMVRSHGRRCTNCTSQHARR